MDHNLSYIGPIWVIQKHNINFTIADTTSIKDTSLNSIFFQPKISPKIWMFHKAKTRQHSHNPKILPNNPLGQNTAKQPLRAENPTKQPLREKNTTKQPLEWKINQSRKNPYLLECTSNSRKSRGHFLNPKPLISRNPCLNPRRNPVFSVPTYSPHRVDELSFLTRRIPTNRSP